MVLQMYYPNQREANGELNKEPSSSSSPVLRNHHHHHHHNHQERSKNGNVPTYIVRTTTIEPSLASIVTVENGANNNTG